MGTLAALQSLILASESPRRRSLLDSAGVKFSAMKSAFEEQFDPNETVVENVQRLAEGKASVLSRQFPAHFVLAADTIVAISSQGRNLHQNLQSVALEVKDGWCFGKPESELQLRGMLEAFSGTTHDVLTSFALLGPNGLLLHHETVISTVKFFDLLPQDIAYLVASREGFDKAGGYAIQGLSGMFIEETSGSFSSIIGLPLPHVLRALRAAGLWDLPNTLSSST